MQTRLKPWLLPWFIIVVMATVLGHSLGWKQLFQVDGWLYDWGITSRSARPQDNIAIVGLTENFIQQRHVSMMPRDRIARLIDILATGKPAVIALDVWLESRIDSHPQGQDAQLRRSIQSARQQGIAILLAEAEIESASTAEYAPTSLKGTTAHGSTLPYFKEAATVVGAVDFSPDADSICRSMPEFMPSLPWLAAKYHSDRIGKPIAPLIEARLRKQVVPVDFVGPPGIFQITPAEDILKQPALAFLLQDKIVFIGATFPRSQDFFSTPYQTFRSSAAATPMRRMYGVELLAQATATILNGLPRRSGRSWPVYLGVGMVALMVAAIVTTASLCGVTWGMISLLVSALALCTVAVFSARDPVSWNGQFWPASSGLWTTLIAFAVATSYRQIRIGQELRRVQEVFSGYVGKEVLQKLGGKMPEMGGEVVPVAVLFCDIEGFSALAEGMRDEPAKLLNVLNQHFEPLVQSLKNHGAYVDNYVGDLVMAVFGAPISSGSLAQDTYNAILAAVDFVNIVEQRNVQRLASGEPPIEVGVGVHCGPAVVGNLGSRQKMHYTAIGDTVNIASRVESTTRKFDIPLLVTEEVMQTCCSNGQKFEVITWEFVAETTVKGRVAPVRLFRPAKVTSQSSRENSDALTY